VKTELPVRDKVEILERIYSPRPTQNYLHQALAAALCALMMFGPLAFGAVEHWSQLVLRLGGASIALTWFAWQVFNRSRGICFSPRIHIPIAIFAITICGQVLLGHTAYYEQTIQTSANWAVYGAILLCSSTLFSDPRDSQRLHVALGVFGFLYALYAIGLHLASPNLLFWSRTPETGGTVFGAYVNRNHYAGLMELLVPLPLVAALRRDVESSKRLLFAFGALLMGASIFVSGSRGGMLALAIQFGVLALLIGSRKRVLIAGVVALVVLVGWLGGMRVADRLGTLANAGDKSNMRLLVVQDGMRMIAEKPLLGWGLGVFPTVYPQFRSLYTDEFVNQAHNDYLQILIETGVVGFLSFAALLWGVLRKAVGELDIWQDDAFSNLSVGAMLGIVGLLVHSFTDFNLQIPANALLFFALCGIASRDRHNTPHELLS
jgi:O-antigen ligase